MHIKANIVKHKANISLTIFFNLKRTFIKAELLKV